MIEGLCTALRSEALVGFDADADLSVQLGYECLRRMLDAPLSYVRILPHLQPYTLYVRMRHRTARAAPCLAGRVSRTEPEIVPCGMVSSCTSSNECI